MAVTSHQLWSARAYQALHRGNPGDVEFYRRTCRGAASILELGVGAGRVLLDVASGASEAVGIDRDAAQVSLAEAEREARGAHHVRLAVGDMAQFELARRFDRILIPYSGFWCLSPRKKRQCLAAARAHLTPSGVLALDVYDASELACSEDELPGEPDVDEWEFLVDLELDQQRYRVFERNIWWPSRQRMRVQYQMRCGRSPSEPAPRRAALLELDHYYLFPQQLREMVQRAGFEVRPLPPTVAVPEGQLALWLTATPSARA